MLKLIWINEKKNKGITYRILKRICRSKDYDVNGAEAEEIIKKESTDFLYVNLLRPANTDDMDRLCLRNITRLRVSVFKLKPIRSRLLKFFFPTDMIKTIVSNILYSPPSEKYKSRYYI